MNEPLDETSAARLHDAAMMLEEAFPDYRCLRCRSDRFLLRLLVPQGADADVFETIETTCKRCGMVETHRTRLLADAILSEHLPGSSDV